VGGVGVGVGVGWDGVQAGECWGQWTGWEGASALEGGIGDGYAVVGDWAGGPAGVLVGGPGDA
jgi:hypothetical protein